MLFLNRYMEVLEEFFGKSGTFLANFIYVIVLVRVNSAFHVLTVFEGIDSIFHSNKVIMDA